MRRVGALLRGERPHPDLDRKDLWIALLVGLGALVLYVRTLYPGLLAGDSGEFQALARLLGNTHPTGYQVYVLLAYPLTWLPVEDVAYRVNLVSALMGALTVAQVYLGGRLLSGRRWPASLGAASLVVSATFWSHAVIAEVYVPAAAFLSGVLLALLYWDRTQHRWALWVAGVLGGLSLGVHLTVALAAPAVLFYLWKSHRTEADVWRTAALGALLGATVAVGAFLLLDALDRPADFIDIAIWPSRSVWGLSERDLDGPVERFVFSFAGRQWQDRMFADPAEVMSANISGYLLNLHNEFSWAALLVALGGWASLRVRDRKRGALLLGTLLCQWIYTFNYDIHDIYVFYIPGYVVIALLVCCGAGLLADLWAGLRLRGWASKVVSLPVLMALAGLVLWPTVQPWVEDVRQGTVPDFPFDAYPVTEGLPDEHLRLSTVVKALEQDAIVFANWRDLYRYYYVAHIELGRRDLRFLEEKPYRPGEQAESSMLDYVDAHVDGHPIYFTQCWPEVVQAGYRCLPAPRGMGTLYKVLR